MSEKISVVIPTRNRRALLERLIGQLVRADVADQHEIIVIDEASTDDTPELLGRLERAGQVRAIRHDPPLRLPGARNAGLAAATGQYVAWIDDDDLTAPTRLVRQREALNATGARWSCAAAVDIDDELSVIGHRRCPPPEGLLDRLIAFNCIPAAAQGLLVERTLAEEVGGFDTDTNLASVEDWDFCIRLAIRATPHMLDEPLVGYRTGFASMSTDTERMERSIVAVYEKNVGPSGSSARLDVAAMHQSLLAADLLTSRRHAARRVVRLLKADMSARNLARCGSVLVAPSWFASHSARRRRAQVPTDWGRAAEEWLREVKPHVDSAAPDE